MSPSFASGVDKRLEPGVEESLKGIEENLHEVLGRRERILKTSRDCISLCSKAIVHLHTGKTGEAQGEIKEAEKVLKGLRKEAGESSLSRYLASPEAEFVEASCVEAIVLGKPIPNAKQLGVTLLVQVKKGKARMKAQEAKELVKWAEAFNANAEVWHFKGRGHLEKRRIFARK